ncbi:hypothetical protein RGQ15_20645 [Paracoccus sp. MBLB3053]|uniref:Anti-sigma factor n=1 Tax=Paracoccus aurantius TaxID=3073814 RepID=A0ABU2HY24_9RHOB|nr:hypothetical protein [Paracoccus sp. MBLB3053]MDS9469962.1 hypothetical protein [Paracoccus sp. MBLB3053]
MDDQADRPDDITLMAYVRGTLPEKEQAAVEEAARQLPEVRGDIALLRGLLLTRETGDEAAPGDLGWARLSRAIDAERVAPDRSRRRWLRPLEIAATVLLAVGLWQFAVLPRLPQILPGTDRYAPASQTAGGTLAVAFVPEATEARIRALLQDIGAEIIGGPSALGLWTLGFRNDTARDAALQRLSEETAIVESVQAN